MNINFRHPRAFLREGVALSTFLFLFLFSGISIAQSRIEGEVIGGQDMNLYLAEHFGDNSRVVDTIVPDETGRFIYEMDSLMPAGLYRLYLPDESFLELILGFEDIRFQTIAAALEQSLILYDAPQNEALYDFYAVIDRYAPAKAVLENFIQSYTEDDKALKTVRKQLYKIFKAEQAYLNKLRKKQADSFVSAYLDFLYEQEWDTYSSKNVKIRQQIFEEKNWSDSLLVNSDAFSKGIIDFLMLYGKAGAGKEEQAMLFRKASDELFAIIPEGTPAYDYALLYLMEGFEQYEMETVIMHIVKNHAPACSQTEGKLVNRVSFYEHFYNGAKVPDFILPDVLGEPHQFYNETGEYTLLVFWATWCGHCEQMNLALKDIYPQMEAQGIKLVSVSLDSNPQELQAYLERNNLPWEVYTDYLSWESPVAEQFHLYATPTMFLLNDKHRLLGKPLNLNQLIFMINQL